MVNCRWITDIQLGVLFAQNGVNDSITTKGGTYAKYTTYICNSTIVLQDFEVEIPSV